MGPTNDPEKFRALRWRNGAVEGYLSPVAVSIFYTIFLDEAPKIAFSCDISSLTMVYGRYNYS